MKAINCISVVALAGVALSGCVSSRSYVDPQYRKAGYDAIARLDPPIPVALDVKFLRNGALAPEGDPALRANAERTLRATGAFVPAADAATASRTISIVANNISDSSAAGWKGFGTGLTFGLAGSTIEDGYEFTCTYRDATGHGISKVYKDVIYTALGDDRPPAGQPTTTANDAFAHVVEDAVLNFVKDLEYASAPPPAR